MIHLFTEYLRVYTSNIYLFNLDRFYINLPLSIISNFAMVNILFTSVFEKKSAPAKNDVTLSFKNLFK